MKTQFFDKICFFSFLASLLLLAQNALSTILEKMDIEKLTSKAHLIVIGNVVDIGCEWDEQWKLIFTYVTLSVDQYVKGGSQKTTIEIMYPGGVVGSKRLYVDGTPEFVKGEKVFLFLEPEIKNHFRVVGWYQGKKTIVNDQVVGTNKSINEFIKEIKDVMKKKQTK